MFFKEERNKDFGEKLMQIDLPVIRIYSYTCPLLLLILCDVNSENFILPKYRMWFSSCLHRASIVSQTLYIIPTEAHTIIKL
jgi:hypothetical protein